MLVIKLRAVHPDGLNEESLELVSVLTATLDVASEQELGVLQLASESEALVELVTNQIVSSLGVSTPDEPIAARRAHAIATHSGFRRFRPRILQNDVRYEELPPGAVG